MVVFLSEEFLSPRRLIHHSVRGHTDHLHYSAELVTLAISGENRVADVQLGSDAPETPHVDSAVIGNAKHDLRSSVEPALDVGVNLFVQEGAGAKIDDLEARLVGFFEQNVFRLQVAVDDLEHLQVLEGVKQLNGKAPDQVEVEALCAW